jgi:hypothetical protein
VSRYGIARTRSSTGSISATSARVTALVAGAAQPPFAEVERDVLRRVGELLGQRRAALPDALLDGDEAF